MTALVGYGACPLIGLAVAVVAHVLLSRAAASCPRPIALGASALGGLGAVAVVAVLFVNGIGRDLAPLDRWAAPASWALAYLALAYLYVFGFFNLGESARRIRLLIELDAAGPRGLTRAELLRAYNARTIVEARLARLAAGGEIEERAGRYVVKRRTALVIAHGLSLLKLLYLGAASEFGPTSAR